MTDSGGEFHTDLINNISIHKCLFKTCFLCFSVYERGDSVALAVQSGKIEFPEPGGSRPDPGGSGRFSDQLKDLVLKMLNLDISFRLVY